MKKHCLWKSTALICASAACFSAMTAMSPSGVFANANESNSLLNADDAAVIAELLDYFGYDSIDDLRSGTRTLPDVSHIKDLDGDNMAKPSDAMYLLQFLQGKRLYLYEYSELDVTGDYIVNQEDSQEYLHYYAYYTALGITPPISAHGSLRTIDSTFENRSYWRYDCATQTKDANPYAVSTSSCFSSLSNEQNELQVFSSSQNLRSFTGTEDQRFVTVHTATGIGTGFIIGKHLIATAAHCLYNRTSGNFTFSSVKRYNYTYDNSGNIAATTAVSLTPLSVHVPVAYDSAATDNDYALIVVSEDLSTYGYCNLGMIIDGVDILYLYSSGGVDYVDGSGTDIKAMGYVPSGSYNPLIGSLYLPGTTYGELYNFNSKRFTTTADHASGESGGAIFIKDCTNNFNTVFGIHTSSVSDPSGVSPCGSLSRGLLITRPILQFYYYNPTITY